MRGGTVDVDSRRVGRIIVTLVLVALAVMVVVLSIAGYTKNANVTSLRTDGVRVEVTVRTCEGQLGGSGSNAAAYRCIGTFVLAHRRVDVTLPGSEFRTPGTSVLLVAARNDPGIVATVAEARGERTSLDVYLLPSVLFILLVALVAVLIVKRRPSSTDVD